MAWRTFPHRVVALALLMLGGLLVAVLFTQCGLGMAGYSARSDLSEPSTNPSLEQKATPSAKNMDFRSPMYLQGYRQHQLLCPGGDLAGRVSMVVVDPSSADSRKTEDCTLADMRQANPNTKFLAYLDVAAMREFRSDQGAFHNSCADAAEEGRQFAITSDNSRLTTDDQGHVVYPGYQYLVVADLSAEYADKCVQTIRNMLSTDSVAGNATDAAPTRFDGVVLDDVNMSPGHGINMDDVGQWGPWTDDAAYAEAMIETVTRINDGLDSSMGYDVPLLVNLGMSHEDPAQVRRATTLARTGAVSYAFREFTTATGSGTPFSAADMIAALRTHRLLARAGMSVIQHDYSVPLRDVPTSQYTQGQEISSDAQCLAENSTRVVAVRQAAQERRMSDYRMLLAHTLLTRTREAAGITASLPQAEPFCQTNYLSKMWMAENVTDASIIGSDGETDELLQTLHSGAYSTATPIVVNGVLSGKLSNGHLVFVNAESEVRQVRVNGVDYEIPGRSGVMKPPRDGPLESRRAASTVS